jgi:2-oxoglutarate/2-oxoacid ferredoxin oxidoreductase subunit alpha
MRAKCLMADTRRVPETSSRGTLEREWTLTEVGSNDLTVLIGGAAGQGVESGGAGLALAAARAGLHVFANSDVRSRIRGGDNFNQIRLTHRRVYSHSLKANLLVALTSESVAAHASDLAEGAGVILPEGTQLGDLATTRPDLVPMGLPLMKIAKDEGSRLMLNTAALAAAAAVVGVPLDAILGVISRNFSRKGAETAQSNVRVAEAAYAIANREYAATFPHRISPPAVAEQLLVMNGNQAFALGSLAGGCRFIAAYPMTPATTIIEWLAALPGEYGVVCKHTEDEIAAVCMAIGASFAGARAMTATSGGGFCLMVEAMGLAGMTEVPVVIVNAQRGGPSTGLPTRTEQSDLLFAIHAGQGEFPRIVLAPGTSEECFEAGWRAFNLAEQYQCPVVVMTDTFLASSLTTVESSAIDFRDVTICRGETLDGDGPDNVDGPYERFKVTESGVSPRALPGDPGRVFRASSDEHDGFGHIIEEAGNRVRMMQKRMRKLETARAEMRGPALIGRADAEIALVCWGSTAGPCREAATLLNARGTSASVLAFGDLWPLPVEVIRDSLVGARHAVVVEQNYTAQLAKLLRMEAGVDIRAINKYDGRPFSPEEIVDAVLEEVGVGV